MQVIEGLEGLDSLTAPFAHASVAVGTFDGVHVGHQAIIGCAVQDARTHARPALVFTFDRHPSELLRPALASPLLTTPAQRNRLIADLGADALIVARFDAALANLPPDEFVAAILKARLGAESITVGSNFGFGKDRQGNQAYLEAAQSRFRFTLHALDPVLVGGEPASSTRVRESLLRGDVQDAETVLGHPFWLAGTVVGGQRLGRTLGYPTANLDPFPRQVVVPDGIYAVTARLDDGRTFGGACSIGHRPTIEGAGRSIETFLLDFSEDIYGRGLELRFHQRLRGEEKFDSLDALTEQMARDVAQARQLLEALPAG